MDLENFDELKMIGVIEPYCTTDDETIDLNYDKMLLHLNQFILYDTIYKTYIVSNFYINTSNNRYSFVSSLKKLPISIISQFRNINENYINSISRNKNEFIKRRMRQFS